MKHITSLVIAILPALFIAGVVGSATTLSQNIVTEGDLTVEGVVGIGTSTPGGNLHVQQSSVSPGYSLSGRAVGVFERNDAAAVIIRAASSAQSFLEFADDFAQTAGQIVYDHTDDSFSFGTNSTLDRLVIDSSGKVGIGTDTPRSKLHVVETGGNNYSIIQGTTGGGGTAFTSGDTLPVTSGNGFIGYNGLAVLTNKWGQATDVDSHRAIYLAGSQSNGGGTTFANLAFANWGYFTNTGSDPGGLENATAQGDAVKFRFQGVDLTGEFDQRLDLLTRSASGTNTTALSVLSNGNVGIGTNSPVGNLSIFDDVVGDVGISFQSGGGNRFWIGQNTSSIWIGQGANITSNKYLLMNLNGDIGVGTDVPRNNLSVERAGEDASLGVWRYSDDVTGPRLVIGKTRGTTVNTNTVVQVGDSLGGLYFRGGDGGLNTPANGGAILGEVDGSAANTKVPTALIFTTMDTSGNFLERMRLTSSGDLGIGKSPSTKLDVDGTITGTVKDFQIDHPLDPEGKNLRHSSVEGPEISVFYRGEAQLENGVAIVSLPDYFEALTRQKGRTLQLTAKGGWSPLYLEGEIQNGMFTVRTTDAGNQVQEFYWEVKAVRADVPELRVEREKI